LLQHRGAIGKSFEDPCTPDVHGAARRVSTTSTTRVGIAKPMPVVPPSRVKTTVSIPIA
jgi:hypothetical protein